jgi:UDP-N-acetylglucosamine:LPS N-acetylglucosamine transferase
MKKTILFFSRGRGHGHALPDLAITQHILASAASIEVQLASYATGATTIRAAGHPVIDLGLPEENPFLATLHACAETIERLRPNLVVAHEEFAALSAARFHRTPTIFISAWLPPKGSLQAETLESATKIIVLGHAGVFPVPDRVCAPVIYTGPVVRSMAHTSLNRAQLRMELRWAAEDFCIVGVPGGAAGETQVALADVVVSAFLQLPMTGKRLVWLASRDTDRMRDRLIGLKGVSVLPFQHPVERLLAAADLIITRGTRGITHDAASVGVPSLSLSSHDNLLDDILVPRIRTNLALSAPATDAPTLAAYLERIRARLGNTARKPIPESGAACKAATEIVRSLFIV